MGTCKEWQNPSSSSGLCPHQAEGGQAGRSRTCGCLAWAPSFLRLPAPAGQPCETRWSSRWQVFAGLLCGLESDPCAFFLGPLDCARTVAANEHHL